MTDNPDDIELLLPWYATGRLSEAERARVEAHLAAHPAARANLDAARAEHGDAVALNENLATPGAGALERLMGRIAAESGPSRAPGRSWVERLGGWIDALSPRAMGAVAAGFLAIVVIQAITIGALVKDGGPAYETASGNVAAPAGEPVIVIAFAPTATAEAITSLLTEAGAILVDGPRAGGLYGLRLEGTADPARSLDLLRAHTDVVSYAAPSR